MPLVTPTPSQALAGLRAVMSVLTASGPIDSTRRALLDATQKHVLQTSHDLDRLEPITPEDLATAIDDARIRDQIARALCLYVMIPDTPVRSERQLAERFVRALGGADDALERMRSMYDHRMILLRFDAMRTSFLGDSMRRRFQDEGVRGVLANIGEVLGVHESEEVAARYRALADCPEGSLGRAFHTFYDERGFAFPGEKGGAPESIIAHDLTHVLTGYSTDLPSEACVTAFQAGYRREGPFTGILFVLLNMEKGVQMTKLAPGAVHMFGEPGMADRIVDAWVRGTRVTIDLVTEWDYWADMPLALDEVRHRHNVTL